MNSQPYDIVLAILIVIYAALVFSQYCINELDLSKETERSLFIAELILLGLFISEIFLNFFAFRT